MKSSYSTASAMKSSHYGELADEELVLDSVHHEELVLDSIRYAELAL